MANDPLPAGLAELRRRIRALERIGPGVAVTHLDGGALDAALPWAGLPPGLHEIVAASAGDGAPFAFAAALAAGVAGRAGRVLWCRLRNDRHETGDLYGPGLARFGLAADRLIVAEAKRPTEVLWAMEEGLRSRGLAAVVGEVGRLDLTLSRRLQLAAEGAPAAALVVRTVLSAPATAALTRWRIGAAAPPAAFAARLERCRYGAAGSAWQLGWDDDALRFRVVALLAGGTADADRAA